MIHAIRHFIFDIYPLIILFWIVFFLPWICLAAMWAVLIIRIIIEGSFIWAFYKIKRIMRRNK